MTLEECEALIDRALKDPALGVCIMALKAVRELELCAKVAAFTEMEPVVPEDNFEGKYMESKYDGFCSDCGTPYADGELVFWQGRGKGVLCQGCRVAETDPKIKAETKIKKASRK
jgi:hypothetical protein